MVECDDQVETRRDSGVIKMYVTVLKSFSLSLKNVSDLCVSSSLYRTGSLQSFESPTEACALVGVVACSLKTVNIQIIKR